LKYQNYLAIKELARGRGGFSERQLAKEVGISRAGLRSLMTWDQNIQIGSMVKVMNHFEREINILATCDRTNSDCSTVAVAYKVMNDGPNSWKLHFMDLVDEFRRTLDSQLFLLEPPNKLPKKLKALLASIVLQLCEEVGINAPSWSQKVMFLEKPWFVSGVESLKALALLESPLAFRRNNIFVLSNFLERV
jgi:hypothetical protein